MRAQTDRKVFEPCKFVLHLCELSLTTQKCDLWFRSPTVDPWKSPHSRLAARGGPEVCLYWSPEALSKCRLLSVTHFSTLPPPPPFYSVGKIVCYGSVINIGVHWDMSRPPPCKAFKAYQALHYTIVWRMRLSGGLSPSLPMLIPHFPRVQGCCPQTPQKALFFTFFLMTKHGGFMVCKLKKVRAAWTISWGLGY